MHKDGKWAKQIIELQDSEGKWGIFHSMSQPTSASNFTTEQALRRLERLGCTIDDECIQKAVWNETDRRFFKKGIDDPKFRLIKFHTIEATFWIEGKFRTCKYK